MAFFSCKKENMFDCFKGTGDIISKKIELAEFQTLYIEDKFDVNIFHDSIDFIEISAGENLIPSIIVENKNGTLSIRNDNKCNWTRSYRKLISLDVHTQNLNKIEIYGPSDIFFHDTLSVDTFYIDIRTGASSVYAKLDCNASYFRVHSGTGTFKLEGHTQFNYVYSIGYGFVYSHNFIATNCQVINNSTGDCFVYASDKLQVEYNSVGNIYYYGNPETIEILEQSTGKILAME